MEGDDNRNVGDDTQGAHCSGIGEAGPQDTSDDEPSEDYMA